MGRTATPDDQLLKSVVSVRDGTTVTTHPSLTRSGGCNFHSIKVTTDRVPTGSQGLSLTGKTEVNLANPQDPLSVAQRHTTITVAGNAFAIETDSATRTKKQHDPPGGRQQTVLYDARAGS